MSDGKRVNERPEEATEPKKFVDKQPVTLFPWHHSTKTVVEMKRIAEHSTRIVVEKSTLVVISTKL